MTESEKRKQIRQIVRMYTRFSGVQEEDLDELVSLVSACKTTEPYRWPFRLHETKETLLHFQSCCFRKCDDKNTDGINVLMCDEM